MTSRAGLEIKPSQDMTRIQAVCEHQRGLIYVVPAERSWVCNDGYRPAHALAGFFRELAALKNSDVEELMRQWGIFYRQLPAPDDLGSAVRTMAQMGGYLNRAGDPAPGHQPVWQGSTSLAASAAAYDRLRRLQRDSAFLTTLLQDLSG